MSERDAATDDGGLAAGAPLRPETVAGYLRSRGVIQDADAPVTLLSGGVSSLVLAVRPASGGVVVKQALPRLKVAQEWLAAPWRSLTEARALQVLGTLTPGSVPPVLDVDTHRWTVTIPEAPAGHRTWKEDLLAGQADPTVAGTVGRILGTWHRRTAGDPAIAGEFASWEVFDQLRLDPFYRVTAAVHPPLAEAIGAVLERTAATRRCLVSGDYSPKNVLLAPDLLWVIDLEVAHYGDPAFDLGFLLTHLVCKSVRRPACLPAYRACADAFLAAYAAEDPPPTDPDHLTRHLGCLLLARVDGKSPAEYLDPAGREIARRVARRLLTEAVPDVPAAWDLLTAELAGRSATPAPGQEGT